MNSIRVRYFIQISFLWIFQFFLKLFLFFFLFDGFFQLSYNYVLFLYFLHSCSIYFRHAFRQLFLLIHTLKGQMTFEFALMTELNFTNLSVWQRFCGVELVFIIFTCYTFFPDTVSCSSTTGWYEFICRGELWVEVSHFLLHFEIEL